MERKTILKRSKKKRMKKPNKVGGGAKTNLNGLAFEQTTDLQTLLENLPDFTVSGNHVFKGMEKIAELCGKRRLYKNILEPRGVYFRQLISKRLDPDDAILVGNTVYIIEKKFQNVAGSVDEKLQTCDFKKKQYTKLLTAAKLQVEYIYILNNWFEKPEYNDVRAYIREVGCMYFFYELPLEAIGLGSK